MKIYRILLFISLIVASLIVYALIYNKNDYAKSSDHYTENSSSEVKQLVTEVDGASDRITIILRNKLFKREFDELNKTLEEYQAAFEEDISNEERLFTASLAFRLNSQKYEPFFNDWIKAAPDKYQPYQARAEYYYKMGWEARGGKWASETEKEQFNKMSDYFRNAEKDIDKVLSINKQTILPYNLLIGIANAEGRDDAATAALQSALQISPASYNIRSHYIMTITPRWGGSFELMQTFIEESRDSISINPKLAMLEGYLYGEAGDIQASNSKYSVAEEFYTKSLTYGENHVILEKRGKNSYKREKYQEAINDLDWAIKLYPEDGEYYYWRSKAFSQLEKYNSALSDIIWASRLEPDDEDIVGQREWLASKFSYSGYELNKSQKPDLAIEKYNAALRLTPDDAKVYNWRARAFIDLNQLDSAENDIKKAIELDQNDINYYLLLDWILAKRKDWDQIIAYWDKFIEFNPKNSRAYVERGGAYFHKGDMQAAVNNAKIAADMGNIEGKQAYDRFRHLVE